MDEGLKRQLAKCVPGTSEWRSPTMTVAPATIANLLTRLSAAADRERELVEVLRPFAGVVALLDDGLTYSICTENGTVIVEDDDFRNAARALQAKGDPTP